MVEGGERHKEEKEKRAGWGEGEGEFLFSFANQADLLKLLKYLLLEFVSFS